ncbi:MAG: hypothetical protein Q7K40_01980 [bacterium]|nr:hypothetical protein [bacterium]
MSVASDSLHALTDGSTDYWAAIVVLTILWLKNTRFQNRISLIDITGTRVISIVLVISAISVSVLALFRILSGVYVVLPVAIIVAGVIGVVMDFGRWWILTRAMIRIRKEWEYPLSEGKKEELEKKIKRLLSLIKHAWTDAIHSGWVIFIGAVATAITLLVIALIAHGILSTESRGVSLVFIKWVDYIGALLLTGYMLHLSKEIWLGHGCGHEEHNDHAGHSHGPGCHGKH